MMFSPLHDETLVNCAVDVSLHAIWRDFFLARGYGRLFQAGLQIRGRGILYTPSTRLTSNWLRVLQTACTFWRTPVGFEMVATTGRHVLRSSVLRSLFSRSPF